ncbi:MAG: SpoIIE family protein phosphatase [Acidobacteriota bacterium]
MPQSVRPPALPPAVPLSRVDAARAWLRQSLAGRALVIGVAIKILTRLIGLVVSPLPTAIEVVDTAGSLALVFAVAYLLTRVVVGARRRLLWRVRRRLILSYVFVGLVPGLLIIAFFLVAGLLLFFNVSSYLVQSRVRALVDQSRFLAESTLLELQRAATAEAVQELLDRRQAAFESRYPFLSIAALPLSGLRCEVEPTRAARVPRALPAPLPRTAGPWRHLPPPAELPTWIGCDGFAGLLAYEVVGEPGLEVDPQDRERLVVRAVAVPEMANPTWGIVLDLPVTVAVEERIHAETGIRLGEVSALPFAAAVGRPTGRPLEARPHLAAEFATTPMIGNWVAFLDYVDWSSGAASSATVAIWVNAWEIYERISTISPGRLAGWSFGQIMLALLAVVGTLFLVIQFVALGIGFVLAKQMTGAVHDLFTGTQHLRNRDFTYQIPVRARDQLGELAESFNQMTAEITTLIREVAEKGRMEQEMLAAREIQRKLLPSGPLGRPGLAVSAFCEPAREVAGDYYDFLPIDGDRTGVLIADVSGKGLPAGLYMAQLKVLVQSVARVHVSPRDFLVAVNRVVADNIDSRSFITMAYAVVDVRARRMTLARAGHCPVILVPGDQPPGLRKAQVLTPDGLVLGLKIDDGEMFESMLQEVTVPLAPGDLVVFFTDGISETMNEAFDCFGEGRLARVLEEYAHLPFPQLRSYINAELHAFSGGRTEQHDDMTMILLRVEETAETAVA